MICCRLDEIANVRIDPEKGFVMYQNIRSKCVQSAVFNSQGQMQMSGPDQNLLCSFVWKHHVNPALKEGEGDGGLKCICVNTAGLMKGGLWYGGCELWGVGKYSSPLSRKS